MVNNELTVVSVLWQGEFRGRTYSPVWVQRHKRNIEAFLNFDNYICLSNVEVPGVETLPLTGALPGWWAKCELFRQDLGLRGRVLYLDLDTVAVDRLEDIARFPESLAICPSSYQFVDGRPSKARGVIPLYNSSVMVFDVGKGEEIYSNISFDVMNDLRGDQDWIAYCRPALPTFPPYWFKKLRNCRGGPSKGVKVVFCMPWKNDRAVKMFDWVAELWQ